MKIGMNPEVKAKWLDALESGEFTQTTGDLRNSVDGGKTYSHCCLGVMCEVYRRETGKGWWEGSKFIAEPSQSPMDGAGTLPPAVRDWAGVADRNPNVTIMGRNQSVAEHNDGRGDTPRTFREIAAAVRVQL